MRRQLRLTHTHRGNIFHHLPSASQYLHTNRNTREKKGGGGRGSEEGRRWESGERKKKGRQTKFQRQLPYDHRIMFQQWGTSIKASSTVEE